MDLEQSTECVCELICSLFKQVTQFAPVCVIIDDAQWCDPTSIRLIRQLAETQGDDVLIVICSQFGDSQLPFMRHHIPKTVKPNQVRNTLVASMAFSNLFGKVQKVSERSDLK